MSVGMGMDPNRLLLDHGNEILLLVEPASLAICSANAAATRHLGYAHDALVGKQITDIECALSDVFYWEDVRNGVAPELRDVEASYLRADGEVLQATKTITRAAPDSTLLVICALPVGKLQRTENELADLSARLRATLEATADGILLEDRSGAILNMNRRFSQLWQIPEELLLAHDDAAVFEFMAGRMRDPAAYRARLAKIQPHDDFETTDLLTLANGDILERKSRPARHGKLIIGRVFSFTDITERKANESRLKLAASVFTHAHEGIMITDTGGCIVEVNKTFSRITGYSREEALGQNVRILKSGRQDAAFYAGMWRDLIQRGHWHGELWNRRRDGTIYAEKLSIAAVKNVDGESRHYVALFSDITELKEHQHQLEHMAHYDALTGIPNRVLLADRLAQAIAQSQRRKRGLAVVYLDLDGFKDVNDLHGHETGDLLLIAIAQRLRDTLRDGDTLARLGGDEFVAVLTDLGDHDEWTGILARMQEAAAAPVKIRQHTLQLSASMGVTLFPQNGGDADTLLRHADQAMYAAKQAGRNRFHQFDAAQERAQREHHEQGLLLSEALTQAQFVLFLQPKVVMQTGQVVGAEALARWQHPERGLLPPGAFLPLLDGTALEIVFGQWVVEAALAQLERLQEAGLHMPVSINISARHLQHPGFGAWIVQCLARYPGVAPSRVELEITESAALYDLAAVADTLAGLRALGLSVALDDFGTGYSSLTYLRRLPMDTLKIDQSFVQGMLDDTGDRAIVQGVIGLARSFGYQVIAEGVETIEQGQMLQQLGCAHGQGYCIARPMPIDTFIDWARRWQPPVQWQHQHAEDYSI